jgi:hypothetical protein
MRSLTMKLLIAITYLICYCVNIVYLYLHVGNRVLIREENIPQFRRKLAGFLRPPSPPFHPIFSERPLFHPSNGLIDLHHPSKDCLFFSVTRSII